MNNIKRIIKLKFLFAVGLLFIVSATLSPIIFASAQEADTVEKVTISDRLTDIAIKGGFQTDPTIASSPRIIGLIIGAFIAFAGLTFLILMIIAGYGWMTASGNEEKVKKATSTVKTSIIGLIVSISGYILWNFIFNTLLK